MRFPEASKISARIGSTFSTTQTGRLTNTFAREIESPSADFKRYLRFLGGEKRGEKFQRSFGTGNSCPCHLFRGDGRARLRGFRSRIKGGLSGHSAGVRGDGGGRRRASPATDRGLSPAF